MDNELSRGKGTALSTEQTQAISIAVQEIVGPVMERIGKILENNTQAMEQIAATQHLMSTRISDLEKQVRLKTPFSRAQEKHLGDAIRQRAREILDGKGFGEDRKALTKLTGIIRKSVLARYGVDSLREVPAYDYETALEQVSRWNNLITIRDITKEARERGEHA